MTEPSKLWIFCTTCQKDIVPSAGRYLVTAKGWKRFVCLSCIARINARRMAA